jgi:hypothetical protein
MNNQGSFFTKLSFMQVLVCICVVIVTFLFFIFVCVQYTMYEEKHESYLLLEEMSLNLKSVKSQIEDYKYLFSIPSKYRDLSSSLIEGSNFKYRLLYSLFNYESGWNEKALNWNENGTYDISLGQLNSASISDFRKLPGCAGFDPYNPFQNIEMGFKYILYLYEFWNNDLVYALASYNTGMGTVSDHGVTRKGQTYISRVMSQPSRFDAFEKLVRSEVLLKE